MDRQDVVATLSKLRRMDEDAVEVYQDAIGRTGDDGVRRELRRFQDDHRRHTQDIEAFMEAQGWDTQAPTEEFERFMRGIQWHVDMAEGGDDAVMLAMDIGERATNAEYAEALRMDVDQRCRDVLRQAFADEQRHLAFIEDHAPAGFTAAGASPLGSLETATTGDHGMPYESAAGGSGAYGGMGGAVAPGGGGAGAAVEGGGRDFPGSGDMAGDYDIGRGTGDAPQERRRAAGAAEQETTLSRPRGGLNAGVRKKSTSKGSEMAGGGTGAQEGNPNIAGQVEGDGGSSGSGVAGSGSGD